MAETEVAACLMLRKNKSSEGLRGCEMKIQGHQSSLWIEMKIEATLLRD
jgi:hypothetical protein